MAKLSKDQIKKVRALAKEKRQLKLEELKESDPEAYEEKTSKSKEKKDKLGFTPQDREEIYGKKLEINKPKPKITWNYSEGELVYLRNGEVGIIVCNDAKDIEINKSSHDMKRNLEIYTGKVYVVTSSGNDWYYPKTLKPIR